MLNYISFFDCTKTAVVGRQGGSKTGSIQKQSDCILLLFKIEAGRKFGQLGIGLHYYINSRYS